MNRNVVAVILILAAVVLIGVYAWPKLKPYLGGPEGEPGVPGEMTTVPL